MERIKQALERARYQRGEVLATPRISKVDTGDEQKITYSQTQIVDIAPDTLRINRVISGQGLDDGTRSYRMLRTQVLQKMVSNGWNSLAITSPGPDQGKTLTAINLAISIAKEISYTVLLVDLDLRKPTIHRYFGHSPEHGLNRLFDG